MTNRPPVPRSIVELEALIRGGEQREVEFKETVGDNGARRKVVRAVAAMANLRHGGLVVLGVTDSTGAIVGLPPAELSLWSDRDKARSAVNAFLDPAVDLQPHRVGDCVVLEVRPFLKTPVIVRVSKGVSDSSDGLVEGQLIYRSSMMTSSAPIARLEDWSELRETLILRAHASARKLDEERKRAEVAADEERIVELVRAAQETLMPRGIEPERPNNLLGIVTGIRLFQIRSQQTEAKTYLKAAYTALQVYWQETDRYPATLADAGFQPSPGGRYIYRAVEGEIFGGEQVKDRAALVADGIRVVAHFDTEPHIGTRSFLVMAVTRIEPEGMLDVWFIDRFGEPRCLTPETTDKESRRWKRVQAGLISPLDAPSRF